MSNKKTSKSNDMSTKTTQYFGTLFAEFQSKNVRSLPWNQLFPGKLEIKGSCSHLQEKDKRVNLTISLLVFYPTFQIYMKCVFYKNLGTQAATGGVLWKKVFIKISQNSQENPCAGVFYLIKLQVKLRTTAFLGE